MLVINPSKENSRFAGQCASTENASATQVDDSIVLGVGTHSGKVFPDARAQPGVAVAEPDVQFSGRKAGGDDRPVSAA